MISNYRIAYLRQRLHLVQKHGFVCKFHKWFRFTKSKRAKPCAITSDENQCLHSLSANKLSTADFIIIVLERIDLCSLHWQALFPPVKACQDKLRPLAVRSPALSTSLFVFRGKKCSIKSFGHLYYLLEVTGKVYFFKTIISIDIASIIMLVEQLLWVTYIHTYNSIHHIILSQMG